MTDWEKLKIEKDCKTLRAIKTIDNHKLLVDAIIGCGNMGAYYNTRFCKFTGNQYNAEWSWRREQLEIQTLDVLIDMYSYLNYNGGDL